MTNIDPPARIVIIGAGPIGIEAAVYARFLGHDVSILEQGEVANSLRAQREQPLWGPVSEQVTRLGLEAVAAQQSEDQLPNSGNPTIGDWLDRYVLRLADTDLVADSLVTNATVVDVGPCEDDSQEYEEDADHLDVTYLHRDENGEELKKSIRASTVIDASGDRNSRLSFEPLGIPVCSEWNSVGDIGSKLDNGSAPPFSMEQLILPLPYYYCIGARSTGSYPHFRLRHGHAQIRDLFKLIGGRETLDLYQV